MRKVIFDTDIGSDIDDAVALAYLLSHPQCDLLGITIVSGDVRKRAEIAYAVCRAYGRDVAIYEGIGPALGDGPGQPNVPHWDAVADRVDGYVPNSEHAVDWMRRTLAAYPGEIDLLTVGPLTNIATIAALDPEAFHRARQTVSMMARFCAPVWSEWNCRCDPAACQTVLQSSWNQTLIGIDVTERCTMAFDDVQRAFAEGPKSIILPMAAKWFESSDRVTFHDPLAAATVFQPELCRYRVGTASSDREGVTTFVENAAGPHRMAHEVNSDAFFAEYFKMTL